MWRDMLKKVHPPKWEYFLTLANSAVKSDSISDLILQPI